MMREILDKMRQMEDQIAFLSAELARMRAVPSIHGRPQHRIGRTYDTGSYPTGAGANTFPFEFVDTTYTLTAGAQTPTVTSRDTSNIGLVHNLTDEKIPVGELIHVFAYGDRWYTTYGGEATQSTDCEALLGLNSVTSDLDALVVTTDDGAGGQSCGLATMCDMLETIADVDDSAPDRLMGHTDLGNCGWYTPCDILQGLDNYAAEEWRLILHNPNSSGNSTDGTCEWTTVCDVLENGVSAWSTSDDPITHVYIRTHDGSSTSGCGRATVAHVLKHLTGYANDTDQVIFHAGGTADTGADDTIAWTTICGVLTQLPAINSDLSGYILADRTTAGECGFALICDVLKTLSNQTTPNKLLGKTAGGACGWFDPASNDVCADLKGLTGYAADTRKILIINPNTTDSGTDDTCEWSTLCELFQEETTYTDDEWQIWAHNPNSVGAGDDTCEWTTLCDVLENVLDVWLTSDDPITHVVVRTHDGSSTYGCARASVAHVLRHVPGYTADANQIIYHSAEAAGAGDDTITWDTPCNVLLDLPNLTTPSKMLGKKSDDSCGWFDVPSGSGEYCTLLTNYATAQSLDTTKEWVVKLVYTGGAWTCVAVEVVTECV